MLSKKYLGLNFSFYFVLMWYIPFSSLVNSFPRRIYIFFPFFILRWHTTLQTNQNKKLFFKDKNLQKKTCLVKTFFGGLHVVTSSKTNYNLSIKGEIMKKAYLFHQHSNSDCFFKPINIFL